MFSTILFWCHQIWGLFRSVFFILVSVLCMEQGRGPFSFLTAEFRVAWNVTDFSSSKGRGPFSFLTAEFRVARTVTDFSSQPDFGFWVLGGTSADPVFLSVFLLARRSAGCMFCAPIDFWVFDSRVQLFWFSIVLGRHSVPSFLVLLDFSLESFCPHWQSTDLCRFSFAAFDFPVNLRLELQPAQAKYADCALVSIPEARVSTTLKTFFPGCFVSCCRNLSTISIVSSILSFQLCSIVCGLLQGVSGSVFEPSDTPIKCSLKWLRWFELLLGLIFIVSLARVLGSINSCFWCIL
jgi:hypothetical protein